MQRTSNRVVTAAAVTAYILGLLLISPSAAQSLNVTCPRAADIVLVLDQSTSIVAGYPNYDNWYVQVLGFAKSIAGSFPIDRNLTQVGVMKYSSGVDRVFHLNRYGDRESLLNAIDNIDIGGGQTNIAAALRTAREDMFHPRNGARPGVPNILILVTDGTANREADKTLPEANMTKAAGIIIYTVGVTDQVDSDQLRKIATTPEYFFFASNFEELNNVLQFLVENSCKEAITVPTTTTTTTMPSTTTSTTTTSTSATSTSTPTTTTTTTPPTTTTTTTPTTTTTTTTPTTTTTTTSTTTPTTTTTTTTPTTTTTTTTTTSTTTTRNPNGVEDSEYCRKQADVLFLIDTTSNMDYDYFKNYMLKFIKDVITNVIEVDTGRIRVAVISFSDTAQVDFYFSNYSRTVDVRTAVDTVRYGGYQANLHMALSLARNSVFVAANGARLSDQSVTKLIVVVTDNPSANKSATLREAELVRDAGIGIVTIGIGTYLDRYELSAVASHPYTANMFTINTVRNVSIFIDSVKRIICGDDGKCSSSVCHSGQCNEVMNQVACQCPSGRGGELCGDSCSNGADVVFALDASGSIGFDNFQLMTQFVGQIIQTLDIDSAPDGPTISRVGLVTFSDSAVLQFNLNRYTTKAALLQAVNVPYLTGSTNTAQAISFTTDVMFQPGNGDRSNFLNYLVIMTDGNSNNATATWIEAMKARAQSINIITIGIGEVINYAELKSIASAPASTNVIVVNNFTALADSVRLDVADLLCNNENGCGASPCHNGANCVDMMGSYTCSPCPASVTGYNCDRQCSGEIDLVFLLDSAGTVHAERWHYMLDFVEWIVDRVDVGASRTQVAVVYWSDSAYVGFTLNKYFVRQDVIQAARMLPYIGGKTNTSAALKMLRDVIFQSRNGDRVSARNVAVLIANGESTLNAEQVAEAARDLRVDGTVLITVAAEQLMSQSNEMKLIASDPLSRNMLVTPTLSTVMNASSGVLSAICDDVNECAATNPCSNGGTCVNDYGKYFCRCSRGFAGYNCDRRCTQQMDVVFILDISGSVQEKYDNAVMFARNVAYGLDVDSGNVRVGAVAYSMEPLGQFYLRDYNRRETVVSALRFYNPGGSTNTASALDEVRNTHFTASYGARSGSRKVVILVTDGYSNVNTGRTVPAAEELKSIGADIYSIANGEGSQLSELTQIASSPDSHYVLQLGDIQSVSETLLDRLCDNGE